MRGKEGEIRMSNKVIIKYTYPKGAQSYISLTLPLLFLKFDYD